MPGICRRFSRFSLLAMAVSVTAGPGYLPTVGPAPLRFQPPPILPPAESADLPPLAVTEPPTTPAEAAAPAHPTRLEEDPAARALEDAGFETPPPQMVLIPVTNAPPPPPPDPGPMAPQMFIRFFTGQAGTNSRELSVFAPVNFVPPLPLSAPASSTATFQTTPPGQP